MSDQIFVVHRHEDLFDMLNQLERKSFVVNMEPRSAPRPMSGRKGARPYMPAWYKDYKGQMAHEITEQFRENGWPVIPSEYRAIMIISYFPYPKSVKESDRVEGKVIGFTMGKWRDAISSDADNLPKGPMDVIQTMGLVSNDAQFTSLLTVSNRTVYNPRIKISLYK